MSSCPLTSAFHCSLGLNSEAPGYTWISRSTFAALASRAMICTISSRTSPRPPGNWCEARSVVGAANALAAENAPSAVTISPSLNPAILSSSGNFAAYPKLYHLLGAQPVDVACAPAEQPAQDFLR